MSATEALHDNKRIGLIDNESPLFQQAVDAILELAERVKALEEHPNIYDHDDILRKYYKEDSEPAPAPDLDDQIGICVARLLASDPVDWYDVLRAFAAELGVK